MDVNPVLSGGGTLTQEITKRIAYCRRCRRSFDSIRPFVQDRYEFEISQSRDADYVFYNGVRSEILKYSGVRIAVMGENVSPNFMVADYAMAFDKIAFSDRYLWFPLIRSYASYRALTAPRRGVDEVVDQKSEFCAYVMSNTTDSADERTSIYDALSSYKKVNSGGRWRNNVGGRVADKLAFQSKHKFVLALENSSTPGYLTEKFADAAAADAIPIYWGDPDVGNILNPKAFINCHEYDSLQDIVARVRKIDQDPGLYRAILAEPWFPDGVEPECFRHETIRDFLINIFDGDPAEAFRRNRGRWGQKMERQLYDMYYRPHVQGFILLREAWRRIFNK